jgi:hypothetical protein
MANAALPLTCSAGDGQSNNGQHHHCGGLAPDFDKQRGSLLRPGGAHLIQRQEREHFTRWPIRIIMPARRLVQNPEVADHRCFQIAECRAEQQQDRDRAQECVPLL